MKQLTINGTTWRELENLPNVYVSKNGDIASFKKGILTVRSINNLVWGYKRFHMNVNGERKSFSVARCVAVAWVPNPENKPQVNHIDGNKTNNYFKNLEWVTSRENTIHSFNKGLSKKINFDYNPKSNRILQMDKNQSILKVWANYKQIKKDTNYSVKEISNYCKLNDTSKLLYGFKWRHINSRELKDILLNTIDAAKIASEAMPFNRIKSLRSASGHTTYHFQAETGIPRGTVLRIENGQMKKPPIKYLEAIARLYNIDKSILITDYYPSTPLSVH